jgi:hypothetical protein
MKIGPKSSFKLRQSQGNVLELAQVKREPLPHRRVSKSWQGRLMRKLKNKEENGDDDDLEAYKELEFRTSTFRTYPLISLYFLALLRFLIFLYSVWMLKNLWNNFRKIIDEFAEGKLDEMIKEHQFFMKFFTSLLVGSKDSDRCLMLTGLGIFLPMLSILYGYLVAFVITLYTATFDLGTDGLLKSIWTDYCEKKERGSTSKSFFINRLENCTARFDCLLGYSFTLPVMNFLSVFNFKTAPHLSISSGFLLIFLILADELMTTKRKFEIEALLKLLKMYAVIGFAGISWIFFIRYNHKWRKLSYLLTLFLSFLFLF